MLESNFIITTRGLRESIPLPRHVIILIFYPEGDLDHSENLMESKLNQDPSSGSF